MKSKKAPSERRTKLREQLWPGSASLIWTSGQGHGYAMMPRTVSLIATLIRLLSPKLDPSRVYIDLWCRNRSEGIVEVSNEYDFASGTGYTGTRRVRSWQERVAALETLGFVRVKPLGTRKFGFILLLHPHDVVASLREEDNTRVPDWWWDLFSNTLQDMGASLRTPAAEFPF